MTAKSKSWRDTYSIHPAADAFPMMSKAELRKLGEDIKANGLTEPIRLYGGDVDQGTFGRNKLYVLDGRNRLDAMELVGLPTFANRAGRMHRTDWAGAMFAGGSVTYPASSTFDPYAFVASINAHRRHLTAGQKRDAVAKLLEAAPERSDRQVAKAAGVDHKTVAAVRSKAESTGEIPQSSRRVGADGKTRTRRQVRPVPEVELPNALKPENLPPRLSPRDHGCPPRRLVSDSVFSLWRANEKLKDNVLEQDDKDAILEKLGKIRASCDLIQDAVTGGGTITDDDLSELLDQDGGAS